ncbi:MAG: hypothetical protein LH618_08130, partial [Saprospiraceae bacterium]|nr:hypothetical protein [Saprospiraceae bacterium]
MYTVTVTNAQGCTGSGDFNLSIPTVPIVDITGDNSFCENTSADLAATSGFNIYNWSDGQNGQSISVISSATYTVTVTDGFGCTSTDNFTVSELPAPQPVVVGPTSICEGATATFTTTNSFPAYSWSNGQTTPDITVSIANTYTVTVTAANGCTGTAAQTLNTIAAPNPGITEAVFNCDNQLILNAGAGFSSYNWSNGSNSASISVTTSGAYLVTVTNAQGCTGTAVITASIPPIPAVAITGNSSFCQNTSTTLTATAGFTSYLWSSGQTGSTLSTTTAGTYSVTATDAFGCTATNTLLLNAITTPQPIITGPTVICTNSTGTLALNSPFSQYNWSTGAITATITVNSANTYAVTVTDANGCTGTATQGVATANSLSPNIIQLPYTCNGALTLNAGTGFTTYLWSGGQNTATLNVTNSGNYAVTVTDATGCTGTANLAVTVPTVPQVAIAGNSSFCQNTTTTLTAT